jgi:diadenosine tetraphosphate (Ap4A) HIT family hydrolase
MLVTLRVMESLRLNPGRYDDLGGIMNCVFCQYDRSILAQTKLSSAFLDGFPVSKGHALVISKRHVASIWEMTTEEYTDAFDLVRQVKDVL